MQTSVSLKKTSTFAGAIALAGALLVGSFAPASSQTLATGTNTATFNIPLLSDGGSTQSGIFSLASGLYNFTLSWTGITGTAVAFGPVFGVPSLSLLGSLVNSAGTGTNSIITQPLASPTGGSVTRTFTAATAVDYRISIFASNLAPGLNYTVSGLQAKVSAAPVVPVPGPIAGAGLPALLGLLGYGLYRRRNMAA